MSELILRYVTRFGHLFDTTFRCYPVTVQAIWLLTISRCARKIQALCRSQLLDIRSPKLLLVSCLFQQRDLELRPSLDIRHSSIFSPVLREKTKSEILYCDWAVWESSKYPHHRLDPNEKIVSLGLAKHKNRLVRSPRRSFAVGSGINFSFCQMIGDRSTQPRSTIASATLHGIPINVFLGTPRPEASTARNPNRRAGFFRSVPLGLPLAE